MAAILIVAIFYFVFMRILILFFPVLLMFCTSCSKYHTTLRRPTIQDGEIYGRVELNKVSNEKKIIAQGETIELPHYKSWINPKEVKKHNSLEDVFIGSHTRSFLVVKDGKIIYEQYMNGSNRGTVKQVFSVSKAYVVSLLGIAIEEGFIQSLDQPISDFLGAEKSFYERITLRHLANMVSGINFNEFRRLVRTLHFYYSKDALRAIAKARLRNKPGKKFAYKSIDTQLLGMCLEKATKRPPLEYLEEKIWTKLGPEYNAFWSIDSDESKIPKYYGGLNAAPIDLAKYGLLYLNQGQWENQQLIPKEWVNLCVDTTNQYGKFNYCNGFWGDVKAPHKKAYYAAGFNGQYVYVDKTKGIVIVRTGEKKGGIEWYEAFENLCEQL